MVGYIPMEDVGYPSWTSQQVSLWLASQGLQYQDLSKIVLMKTITGRMLPVGFLPH
jgi:hypothetical protein